MQRVVDRLRLLDRRLHDQALPATAGRDPLNGIARLAESTPPAGPDRPGRPARTPCTAASGITIVAAGANSRSAGALTSPTILALPGPRRAHPDRRSPTAACEARGQLGGEHRFVFGATWLGPRPAATLADFRPVRGARPPTPRGSVCRARAPASPGSRSEWPPRHRRRPRPFGNFVGGPRRPPSNETISSAGRSSSIPKLCASRPAARSTGRAPRPSTAATAIATLAIDSAVRAGPWPPGDHVQQVHGRLCSEARWRAGGARLLGGLDDPSVPHDDHGRPPGPWARRA